MGEEFLDRPAGATIAQTKKNSLLRATLFVLRGQVPQGVHASLSGIPWWTTDVGGYGCGDVQPNHTPYMQELIVRWYQFGCFSPIFRTHGCRSCDQPECQQEPDVAPCRGQYVPGSCAANEVWSYGNATQPLLEKYIKLRATLKPYMKELAANVTAYGVPTARPLWWEFPNDRKAVGVNTQFMLGPDYLVAPVTAQNATSRCCTRTYVHVLLGKKCRSAHISFLCFGSCGGCYVTCACPWFTNVLHVMHVYNVATELSAVDLPPLHNLSALRRTVYFPGDYNTQWHHVLDGTTVHGGQTEVVQAPLGSIPVFTTKIHRVLF